MQLDFKNPSDVPRPPVIRLGIRAQDGSVLLSRKYDVLANLVSDLDVWYDVLANLVSDYDVLANLVSDLDVYLRYLGSLDGSRLASVRVHVNVEVTSTSTSP